jgi:hypothetical protein
MDKSIRWRNRVRWTLAAIAAIGVAISLTRLALAKRAIGKITIPGISSQPYNDLTKAGMDLRIDGAKAVFQLTLAALAAVTGLLIAKKDAAQIVLSDYPEVVLLICACLLLLTSLACYYFYLDDVASAYWLGGKIHSSEISRLPDIFDEKIDYLRVWQSAFLSVGALCAGMTLISAHRLKAR